jgi:putrescine aminotransferase
MATDLSDRDHVLHPWGRLHPPRDSEFMLEGDGIHVKDGQGRSLLDGIAGLWCVNVGYRRREIADAMAEQAMRLPFYTAFMESGNEPSTRLAQALAEAAPGDLRRVFFTTGGSTANDSAIRFLHLLANNTGRPSKKHIITRADAYHGSTFLTASCSGKFSDRADLDVIEGQVHHLGHVNPYRRPEGMTVEEFRDAKVAELEARILALGPENVAGFIAEPILASGGVVVPPPGYHRATLEVCRRYDVRYISDEVVTGFGRLGHLFASEAVFGITPDIITCAKGLTSGYVPLGAMLLSDSLCAAADPAGDAVFSHGFTYAAHPVACAAALANLGIIAGEGLCAHVRALAPRFQSRLAALGALPLVGDVRGMGLLAGVEFVADRHTRTLLPGSLTAGKRVAAECRRRGLIVRPLGDVVGISPPLVITEEQIDALVDILAAAILTVADGLVADGIRLD